MPRDYAKKQQATPQRSMFKSMTFWAVLLALVVVAAIYGVKFVQQGADSDSGESLPPVRDANRVVVHEGVKVATPADDSPKPDQPVTNKTQPIQYEFYSMLPEMNAEVSEAVPVVEPAPNHIATSENQPGYWLQIGAYYTEDAATEFQSRVQLLGLDADIVKTPAKDVGSHDIYRVEVGPLATYQEAKDKQHELTQMNLDSLIRKVSKGSA